MEQSKHGEGITSVKVHHKPGGESSFSLAHDGATDDRWGNSGKVGATGKKNQEVTGKPGQAPQQNQTSSNAPWATTEEKKTNAPEAGPGAFTSVKYSGQPPGGRSQITF